MAKGNQKITYFSLVRLTAPIPFSHVNYIWFRPLSFQMSVWHMLNNLNISTCQQSTICLLRFRPRHPDVLHLCASKTCECEMFITRTIRYRFPAIKCDPLYACFTRENNVYSGWFWAFSNVKLLLRYRIPWQRSSDWPPQQQMPRLNWYPYRYRCTYRPFILIDAIYIAPFMHWYLIVSSILDDLAFTIIYWSIWLLQVPLLWMRISYHVERVHLKKKGDEERERGKKRHDSFNIMSIPLAWMLFYPLNEFSGLTEFESTPKVMFLLSAHDFYRAMCRRVLWKYKRENRVNNNDAVAKKKK